MDEDNRIVDFLFEIGTMRKLMRMHRQTLLTDDASDSIASHSYRVSIIGWYLAKKEGADLYTAIQKQLGLKLEPTKGTVDAIIIDHADRPSDS